MSPETLLEHFLEKSEADSRFQGEAIAKLEAIFSEAKKTNGRVTSLESTCAQLANLVSRHSGDFERKAEEFRSLRQMVEDGKDEMRQTIAEWEARRDSAYADSQALHAAKSDADRADRQKLYERLWKVAGYGAAVAATVLLGSLGFTQLLPTPTL
jgi:ABC-type transporter Mla subunit MlaD